MESNLVCNHTSNLENCTTGKGKSNLLIMSINYRQFDKKKSCCDKNMYTICTIQLHRHDVYTVPLHCPITIMTPTMSYMRSTWAGDNQSLS